MKPNTSPTSREQRASIGQLRADLANIKFDRECAARAASVDRDRYFAMRLNAAMARAGMEL